MTDKEKEIELAWQRLLFKVKPDFGRKPNLQSMLFLIGVQELGHFHRPFTKEEKQDLMHIAVCSLMENKGYFQTVGRDDDGWPHFERTHKEMPEGLDQQEYFLKELILDYMAD